MAGSSGADVGWVEDRLSLAADAGTALCQPVSAAMCQPESAVWHTAAVQLSLSDRSVDLDLGVVVHGETRVKLTHNELALLRYLASHPDTAISRHVLHQEVWGYSARVVTRAVDSAVKRLRRKLEADPADPSHLITVYSVGYQLILPSDEAAASALPRLTTACIGRDDTAARIVALLSAGQVLSLTGPGGIGKSHLAQHVLSESDRLADLGATGAIRIALGGVHDLTGALEAALVGADRPSAGATHEAWRAATAQLAPDTVLLFDDADAALDAIVVLIEEALDVQPTLRVVVTSRSRLPTATVSLRIGPLSTQDSTTLFVAAVGRLGLPVPEEVGALVDAIEGVPLALEMAAEHLGLLAPTALLQRLQETPTALQTALHRDPRHQSLHSVVANSWARLAPEEQAALAQLSVFASPFSAAAAEAVLSDVARPMVLLQRLRDRSLVLTSSSDDRMRLLRLVQQFCLGQTHPARQGAAVRHAAWALAEGTQLLDALLASPWTLQASAAGRWAPNNDVMNALDTLAPELEAAGPLYAQVPGDQARQALILDALWTHRGSLRRRQLLLAEALRDAETLPPLLRSQVLAARASVHFSVGVHQDAAADLQRAWDPIADAAPTVTHVTVARTMASVRSWLGDNAQALTWLRHARHHADAIRRDDLAAALWYDEGRLRDRQGEVDASRDCFRELLRLSRLRQDRRGEAHAHFCLAFSHLNHDQLDEAEDHIQRSIAAQTLADGASYSSTHVVRALIALGRGELDIAEDILRRSLAASRRRADRRLIAEDLLWLGLTAHLFGDTAAAEARYTDALAVATARNAPQWKLYIRCLLGGLRAAQGHDEGQAMLEAALLETEGRGWRWGMGLDAVGLRLLRIIELDARRQRHQAAGRAARAESLAAQIEQLWADAAKPMQASLLVRLVARLVPARAPDTS